ncbi:MAG: hypothetical protein KJ706_07530 [Candidatus Omnitrophica bacterium]|nr:hypothetical protein [Candidatus Omnitrophota bacterium]
MIVPKLMRLVLIILVFLAAFFPIYINVSAFAEEISPIEKGIFSLTYLQLKLFAVNNELFFYRSSKQDDKSMLKGDGQYVIDNLNNLNDELFELDLRSQSAISTQNLRGVVSKISCLFKWL